MAYPWLTQKVKDLIIRLTDLDSSLIDRIYPVGSIYMSMNSTNPATLLGGGVWEALPTGRVLVGAGTGYTAGGTGGNKTVTLTVAQLPSHSHANTLAAAGGHSHTRGSMEITGNTKYLSADAVWNQTADGAFIGYGSDSAVEVHNVTLSGTTAKGYFFKFQASNGWSGSTSTVDNHSHTLTNASVGSGSAVNIEQPWLAVYMWKRTA